MAPSVGAPEYGSNQDPGILKPDPEGLLLRKYNRCPCKLQVSLAKNHSQVFKALSIRVNTQVSNTTINARHSGKIGEFCIRFEKRVTALCRISKVVGLTFPNDLGDVEIKPVDWNLSVA